MVRDRWVIRETVLPPAWKEELSKFFRFVAPQVVICHILMKLNNREKEVMPVDNIFIPFIKR